MLVKGATGHQNKAIWPYNSSASAGFLSNHAPNSKFYFWYINAYMVWPQVICQKDGLKNLIVASDQMINLCLMYQLPN